MNSLYTLGGEVRKDFPIFNDPKLVYLDTGASAQKPRVVLDAMHEFYSHGYSNIHRGVYSLSERATLIYDEVREKAANFLGAASPQEIVFTHGTTEGINLVAFSWARTFLKPGDEIIVTLFEHHANFVPWQLAAEATGASIRYLLPDAGAGFSLEEFKKLLSAKTKLVAVTQLANAIGIKPPLGEVIRAAHQVGAKVIVDGAQGASHGKTDVRALDADFYVCSGHKLYGPTGVGLLYGKMELLQMMPPFLSGGDMIRKVSVSGTQFAEPPARFEAGTPHIAGVVGLGAALDYVSAIGGETIERHEDGLVAFAEEEFKTIPQIKILGPKQAHHGLFVFTCDGVHPHDLAQALAADGVCVRAGHHCNQPLLEHLGVQSTTRLSFGMYNTEEDVSRAVASVKKAIRFFAGV